MVRHARITRNDSNSAATCGIFTIVNHWRSYGHHSRITSLFLRKELPKCALNARYEMNLSWFLLRLHSARCTPPLQEFFNAIRYSPGSAAVSERVFFGSHGRIVLRVIQQA